MNLWLFLVNVQTSGEDFAVTESLDKSGLVNDGTASRVDYYHAIFHL